MAQHTVGGADVDWHVPSWRVREDPRRTAPELWLCQALSHVVRFDRAAVALATGVDDRVYLRGSDPSLERFGDVQQTLVEGPEVDVLGTGEYVVADDLRTAGWKWPLLERAGALRQRARSMVLQPVGTTAPVSGETLGFLAVARDHVEPFTVRELAMIDHLAQLVTLSLLTRWAEPAPSDGLALDLEHDHVALATGLFVERLSVEPATALAMLRTAALTSGRTLREVAAAVVEEHEARVGHDDGS